MLKGAGEKDVTEKFDMAKFRYFEKLFDSS